MSHFVVRHSTNDAGDADDDHVLNYIIEVNFRLRSRYRAFVCMSYKLWLSFWGQQYSRCFAFNPFRSDFNIINTNLRFEDQAKFRPSKFSIKHSIGRIITIIFFGPVYFFNEKLFIYVLWNVLYVEEQMIMSLKVPT